MNSLSKEELHKLYVLEKMSSSEIAKFYGCSENKVNYWINKFSIPKRSISDAIYLKRNPNGDPFNFSAPRTNEEHELFGIGLGLYWGEGNKLNRTSVRLGNTDPHLVKVFISFLTTFYNVPREKFRFGIQVFNDVSASEALSFWARTLNFPKTSFGKVVVTPSRGLGTYRVKSLYGVLTIYVSNKKLRDLLYQEIEKLRQMPYSAPVRSI